MRRLPDLKPTALGSGVAFRRWLARHHATRTEILLVCRKVGATGRGIAYVEALDEALCFGWIDGVRRRVDDETFSIRFTPRKPRSIWSRVNVAKVERLMAAGRMAPSGLAAFTAREEKRTGVYSFERPAATLSPTQEKSFQTDRAAWTYFQAQPPWYRRVSLHWVTSAKREETRARRLSQLIDRCAEGRWIGPVAAGKSGRQ